MGRQVRGQVGRVAPAVIPQQQPVPAVPGRWPERLWGAQPRPQQQVPLALAKPLPGEG